MMIRLPLCYTTVKKSIGESRCTLTERKFRRFCTSGRRGLFRPLRNSLGQLRPVPRTPEGESRPLLLRRGTGPRRVHPEHPVERVRPGAVAHARAKRGLCVRVRNAAKITLPVNRNARAVARPPRDGRRAPTDRDRTPTFRPPPIGRSVPAPWP